MRSIEHGTNPQPIAGNKKGFLPLVIDGKGELPIESFKAVLSPLLVSVNDNLGIRPGSEDVTDLFKFLSQFDIVENFAVVGDPDCAVFIAERLRRSTDRHGAPFPSLPVDNIRQCHTWVVWN